MKLYLFSLLVFLIGCAYVSDDEQKKEKYDVDVSNAGTVSFMVVDLESDEIIVSHNESKRLIPASLTKIFTTAAAFEKLGADYRFKTKFMMSGASENSLARNLIVVGGGDPSLGSSTFSETKPHNIFSKLKSELSEAGITSINGDVVIDPSIYNGIKYPSKRIWEDMANYYGAVPSGLSFKENTFQLTLSSPQNVGGQCKIINCEPDIGKNWECFVNSAANNKDSAYIYGHPEMDTWYVSGSIPSGRSQFTIKGAMPDPALLFGRELKSFLQKNGIKVQGQVRIGGLEEYEEIKLIYEHLSPSMLELCKIVNKKSNNLFADHILYQLAISDEKDANWDNASLLLNDIWSKALPNSTANFYDGSGLSPFNRFSASDMVKVLTYMEKSDNKEAFLSSLSIAGEDGTLRNLLKDEGIKGRFIGKSGSMQEVLTYSGYITTEGGKRLAMCIMVNGFTEPYSGLRSRITNLIEEIIRKN